MTPRHHQLPATSYSGDPYSRRWSGRKPTGRSLADRTAEPGEPILIHCDHADDRLCPPCTDQLRLVLADIPALLVDLGDARRKETRFVQHGHRQGQQQDRDEAPIGWNPAASTARARLVDALDRLCALGPHIGGGRAPLRLQLQALDQLAASRDMPDIARSITAAAARAHRVIDAPPSLWYYGRCPSCSRELYLERLPADGTIVCGRGDCDYRADLADHNRAQLDDDRMLTVSELVSAITVAGEVVTRDQINGWIRRNGLPREQRDVPRWSNGQLVTEQTWVYRLGDVRDLALKAEIRKHRQETA